VGYEVGDVGHRRDHRPAGVVRFPPVIMRVCEVAQVPLSW
jgi:hypothetical protein